MSIWRLVLREIGYRKLSFGLAVVSVFVAVGCLVAVLTLLRLHDVYTDELVAVKEAEMRAEMRRLEDDYRKITKNLGFNIVILHKDQDRHSLHALGYATRYMPETHAEKLARSPIVTINHLLPSLHERVDWPERKLTINVVGTRGEVPILHQDPKKPILEPVPPGTMVVGYEIHHRNTLKKGDKVTLLGRDFQIHKLHSRRGTADDITVWINLGEAQQLLGKQGLINAILALGCNCADIDRVGNVRAEIDKFLPDTQVFELETIAIARAEARNRAAAAHQDAIEREKQSRTALKQHKEALAAIVVPLVVLGAIVWLGVLTFGNVRDRAGEIGILRAIGLGAFPIYALFLTRSVLVGLIGAPLGYCAGAFLGLAWETDTRMVFDPLLLGLVLVASPFVCALASWLPALVAARQDPALVLREG